MSVELLPDRGWRVVALGLHYAEKVALEASAVLEPGGQRAAQEQGRGAFRQLPAQECLRSFADQAHSARSIAKDGNERGVSETRIPAHSAAIQRRARSRSMTFCS